tara:strand:- start:537 stop:818 length:282 start_codon:yes stop_codon:yes gene_type:complete
MKANQSKSASFILLILFMGIILGTIINQLLLGILPDGVVKDFFLTSQSIGWGLQANNWVDLYIMRFKTGFYVDISVVSILGMAIAWYFLRYFK